MQNAEDDRRELEALLEKSQMYVSPILCTPETDYGRICRVLLRTLELGYWGSLGRSFMCRTVPHEVRRGELTAVPPQLGRGIRVRYHEVVYRSGA